ncbi:MAG TPA: hypothetical protein PLT07_11375 [Trueperaceae bacterium]|nr:hypothetical protein [Trueperaceae bacterium]
MTPPIDAAAALEHHLKQRVLILDGAMGTMIQRANLTEADSVARASRTTHWISRAPTTCSFSRPPT